MAGPGVAAYLDRPVFVFGLPDDFGQIDGDKSDVRSFRVFNPHRQPVDLEVIAPGCGCDGRSYQRVVLRPLSGKTLTLVTDPTRLKVGRAEQFVVFRGLIGDDTFKTSRKVFMTVRRPSVERSTTVAQAADRH